MNRIYRISLPALVCAVYLMLFGVSCKRTSEDAEGMNAIAKVYGYYLYPEELTGIVPQGSNQADSLRVIKTFIDNWVRRKAVLHQAEKNLREESKDVERKLEEYRNSLITHLYETDFVLQELDTLVSDEEIASFYEANQNNFELRDNIIRVIYLRLSKNSPKLDKVRQWYKSNDKKDRALLADYCHQYALNYFLDDDTWLYFDDVLKEIPIRTYDKEQFLRSNRYVEVEDSSTIYFVNIKGFMVRKSISPLSFEKNNIRTLIINERKLKLIESMEQEAWTRAHKSGNVKVF